MTTLDLAASVEAKVLNADNLPTLPVVALKLIELTQMPDVSAAAIAEVIQNDPALSAKLLKLANSSMFGMPKKIASLQQATVILGLRTVKVMVLSFSVMDCFEGPADGRFDFEKYWRRSLSMAVGAKLLADAVSDLRRDEAFVGGLLADIGMMAAVRCAAQEYEPVTRAYALRTVPIQEVEEEILGVTHATISSHLLAHWGLPDMLCEAVAAHHGEGHDALEGRRRALGGVLWSAAMIADLFCGDTDSQTLDMVKHRCVELTGISATQLETVLEAFDSQVKETASLFAVDIGQTFSYQDIQSMAMAQLAALTVDAELGRVQAARREETTRAQLEELSEQAAVLEHQANTDPLTRIANRQAFDTRLEAEIRRARQNKGSLGLILMDLDRFKRINDTFGHAAGDDALRLVGACLRKISEGPVMAARYGGEEFAVIVGVATAGAVRDLAESIRRSIESASFRHNGHTVRFTASLGVVHVDFAQQRCDAREMFERADQCLYQAKQAGRNRVGFAS
ncbi:MAG TPA: GGDEF domain-containing protein [Phycisphaerae bacterium]|nr:GGDEF domain-containing protein [Phycisphaerae bacterium]